MADEPLRRSLPKGATANPTAPPHGGRPPPEVLRNAFHTCANYFETIRKEWIKSDEEQVRVIASGITPDSGSYEEIMREVVRSGVVAAWSKLRTDSDFLPLILPHCDASLRDAVQRVMGLADVDAWLPDRYGEASERWRQTWAAMGLDPELDALLPKLRAAGDALMMQGEEAGKVAGVIESAMTNALRAFADGRGSRRALGQALGLRKMTWQEAQARGEEWVRAHQARFPGRNQLAKCIGCHPSVMSKAIKRSVYLNARAAEARTQRLPRAVDANVARMQAPAVVNEGSDELDRLIKEQQADARRDARRPRKPRAE